MMQHTRPIQIVTILNTVCTGNTAAISAELETYIAQLEANRTDRPPRIAAILKEITSQYPAEMGTALDSYIAEMEAKQQRAMPSGRGQIQSTEINASPIWSYQRMLRREQQRKERALRKLHSYR